MGVFRLLFTRRITLPNIVRVLILGFALVIILLVAGGVMGVRNTQAVRNSTAGLVRESQVTAQLIDEVQRERGTLNAVFYTLGGEPSHVDRDEMLSQLDDADDAIERIMNTAKGTPEEAMWRQLNNAVTKFSSEARRLLALQDAPTLSSLYLLQQHDEVVNLVSKLTALSAKRALAAQQQIEMVSSRMAHDSTWLLGAALTLALVCAALTVALTSELFRRMEWQTGELSRVSWQLLENQETAAKRFSHELHDELGQSLTAVKANLVALANNPDFDRRRLEDCRQLVDESIRNVRELSQLLHPTILDDFGLDASLRSLAEKFMDRTGIDVEYDSNFSGRMAPETETHLFRIAQEALTNVARHSGATKLEMRLREEGGKLRLIVHDNGRGIEDLNATGHGIGMIGMRARARSMGGELTTHSAKGQGVTIEVWVPVTVAPSETNDPHLVS